MSNLPFWILGAACVVALIAFLRGRSSAIAEAARDNLAAARDKKEKDDEVENLAPADVDARFDRWMRDKDG